MNEFDLAIEGEITPSLFEEAVVDSPNVMMKITKRGGDDVDTAQVCNYRPMMGIKFFFYLEPSMHRRSTYQSINVLMLVDIKKGRSSSGSGR